jgi:hypothetical protein
MAYRPVDWQILHERPLIAVDDCWKRCDGFCCANSHPDFVFRLLPAGGKGTVVAYLEDEYAWMKASGRTVCGEEDGREIQPMVFDFGGPKPLVLRHAPCGHLGRCNDVCTKPLLCRTYPFLPVLGLDGAVAEVLPASIVDYTVRLKEGRDPCPLEADPGARLLHDALAGDAQLAAALAHPRLILATQAAKAFTESYAERFAAWNAKAALTGQAFWQAWEMQYLGRRLVDREAVAAHLRETHAALVARYGEYLE